MLAGNTEVVNYRDAWGRTAIEIAFNAGNRAFVCEVLRLGADPYQVDSNENELFGQVLARDDLELFKCFVSAGYDIDRVRTGRSVSSRAWVSSSKRAPRIREFLLGSQ